MNSLCKELKERAEIALNIDKDIPLYRLLKNAAEKIEEDSRRASEDSWREENRRLEDQDNWSKVWR